jgi:hypothetical protein
LYSNLRYSSSTAAIQQQYNSSKTAERAGDLHCQVLAGKEPTSVKGVGRMAVALALHF